MKILIADDDPQILRALRVTLSARGYDIVTAADGTEAINAAITHKLVTRQSLLALSTLTRQRPATLELHLP